MPSGTKGTPAVKPEAVMRRAYKGSQEINHDLFKLEPAEMAKNVSYDTAKPRYEFVEHSHFYHSHDSNGKKLTITNHVGGHCHEIAVIEEGDVFKVECSTPRKRIKGKYVELARGEDQHKHKVIYISSEKLTTRVLNADAVKVAAYMSTPEFKRENEK